ncbi:MAG: hypothetical protein OXE56_02480 [Gammaproteobacteria bacterium]|nr:hypothetical protein [Gammaproteobacteria bacterium]
MAVPVEADTLNSACAVVKIMIEEAKREQERLLARFPGRVSRNMEKLKDIGKKLLEDITKRAYTISTAGVDLTLHGQSKNILNLKNIPAELVFRDVAPLFENIRLVVFIDEAQNIPIGIPTNGVMSFLHRNTQGIPLITAFFGLSDTENRLSKCGLSRPPDERVVNLGLLTHEEAFEAINRVLASYNFTNSLENSEIWINRLAQLSQGWPQHINRVSVAACRVIAKHEGIINKKLLELAIKKGKKSKQNYYDMIIRRCSAQPWVYKKLAQIANNRDGFLSLDDILQIAQYARTKKGTPVDDFLADVLHAGVLIETRHPPSRYQITIPSLGDYLQSLDEEPPPNIQLLVENLV